jgi:fructoselysine 6-kinase
MAVAGQAGPLRVASVGDNCIDVYHPLEQSAVGGNGLNVAVQLRRVGVLSEYFGAVGNDLHGARIREALEANGLPLDRVRVETGATAVSELGQEATGERTVLSEFFGVCADYAPTEDERKRLLRFDHVHCANLPHFDVLAPVLRAGGVPVSYDFGVTIGSDYFEGLDVAFLGSDEPPDSRASQALAEEALLAGARIAVVTCGGYGSLAFDGGSLVVQPALPVSAVDTCGAGDGYIAAFLAERYSGGRLDACMRAGAEVAARTCAHLGAWPQELEPLRVVTA